MQDVLLNSMAPSLTNGSDLIHVWGRCHACGAEPVSGVRFECRTCPVGPDNDLCEACYLAFDRGAVKHPMAGSYADLAGIGSNRPHSFRRVLGRPRQECAPWLQVPHPQASAPIVSDGFVVRPEFCSKRESFIGGYAFVVDGPPTFLVTALHVLGFLIQAKGIDCSPANDSYSGHELPAIVTKVNLFNVFAINWAATDLGTAEPMVVLPDARIGDDEPFSQRDIAAFRVKTAAKLAPAKLALSPPHVGDPIWLVARPEAPKTERTIAAVVVELTDQTLIFRYKTKDRLPPHTSGAPLLNAKGEVVGINVGGGLLDGHRLGHASHVTSIRGHLGSLLDVQ